MVNITGFIRNNIPLCFCMLGLAIVGYMGYRGVCWIIKKCQKTEKIDDLAKEIISAKGDEKDSEPKLKSFSELNIKIPDGKINTGQGEYLIFHNLENGEKKRLSKEEFEKAYQILNDYAPVEMVNKGNTKDLADRYNMIKMKVQEVLGGTAQVVFIPRTLYELFYIRESIEEDLVNDTICPNQQYDSRCGILEKQFKGSQEDYEAFLLENNKNSLAKKKCWHLCHFEDTGDNDLAGVKHVAFRLNQVMVDTLSPKADGFTYQELSEYTEKQIDYLIEHAQKAKKELKEFNEGVVKEKFLNSIKTSGPTVNFANSENWFSDNPCLGIRGKSHHEAQIIRNAVAMDCSQIAQNAFLLFRGSNYQVDDVCFLKDKNKVYSLSYGTSLFAGALFDSTANAFRYMKGVSEETSKTTDSYVIQVPFDQLNNSPFFIPPKNTLVQLFGIGESFHARTKAWKDYTINYQTIGGIKGLFGKDIYGDHLKSNLTKEEFIKQFQSYKKEAIALK